MVKNHFIDEIPLDGGVLCLDFLNTVHDRKKELTEDYFQSVEDILRWARKVLVISESSYEVLYRKLDPGNPQSNSFFGKALELRDLLYNIFYSITLDKEPLPEELNAFSDYLSKYFNSIAVRYTDNRFTETWKWKGDDPARILMTVVKSAYDLLLSERLDRVKECPNCGWLFLDTTRNGKRKWCSMKSCGSTVKALDYYYRKKGER